MNHNPKEIVHSSSMEKTLTESQIKELEAALAYTFNNQSLLHQALTHSTYAYENKKNCVKDNERLEFLGDCVLDLIIGDLLFRESNELSEGVMTKTRALIVCESTLSDIAKKLNLGEYLYLGKGEEQTKGRSRNSNLSNAMESIIAAIYLDGGFDVTYRVVSNLFSPYQKKAEKGSIVFDYKSMILEYVQGIGQQGSIVFKIVKEEGPDHDRTFFAQVLYFDMIIGCGSGSTKKIAEQVASREALEHIKSVKNPEQFTLPI